MPLDIDGFKEKVFRRTKSQTTVDGYMKGVARLEEFVQFTYKKSLDQFMLDLESKNLTDDIYTILDKFVGWAVQQKNKKFTDTEIMPRTIGRDFAAVKKFLRYHRVTIANDEVKERITLPMTEEIADVPIEKPVLRKMLLSQMPLALRAGIGIMKDGGPRIGETMQLKISDLHLDEDPARITIRRETTKATRSGRFDREIFVTPETVELLKQHVQSKGLVGDDKLFGYFTPNEFRHVLNKYLKKLGLAEKIRGHKFHQIHPHVFRKFFFSQAVGPMGETATHAMMGHSFYLKTYYKKPFDERQADYRRAMPNLVVLQASSDEELRKKLLFDQLKAVWGLSPEQLKAIEDLMNKKNLFEVDEEIQKKIREMVSKMWGLSSPTNRTQQAGVF